ncbi:MAG: acyl carrier protein [bacterium]|nr:acyl carrier protein [bacterium]
MRQKIKSIISEAIGAEVADIDETALLHEDLQLESSDVTDILEEIETALSITIAAKDTAELHSVEDIIDLVSQYVPEEI